MTLNQATNERACEGFRHGVSAPSVTNLKMLILKRELAFSGVLESVLRFLLHRPDRIAFGSAKSVAAECGVSASTIHRLVQHCGYASFRDMRRAFRDHMREAVQDIRGS